MVAPIVTAGGLVFIGATVYDKKFRAFDSHTGQLLWETELPFSGVATPSTYSVDGRQYVVIAAAGGKDPKSPAGRRYMLHLRCHSPAVSTGRQLICSPHFPIGLTAEVAVGEAV